MPATTRRSKRLQMSTASDSEGTKPPKRPRIAPPIADTRVPLPDLVKDPNLWFSDGSIVLAAGNQCFKVHRSQLARFCIVFGEMFEVPSGGLDEEMMDDCVVVRMPDDAVDLANFLRAMYDGYCFNFSVEDTANLPAVVGVMRLATKYDCEVFRTMIWTSLRKTYSTEFRTFFSNTKHGPMHHVRAILLARECDLPDILPSCFYQLTFSRPGLYDPQAITLLAPEDRTRVNTGKEAILQRLIEFFEEGLPLEDVTTSCQFLKLDTRTLKRRRKRRSPTRSKCAYLVDYWAKKVAPDETISRALRRDPLQELSKLAFDCHSPARVRKVKAEVVCSQCSQKLAAHFKVAMKLVWDNISNDFML